MPLQAEPCEPWPLDLDCTSCAELLESPGESPGGVAELIERWSTVATSILWRLSGRRWGPSCPVTVRPCRKSCLDDLGVTTRWFGASAGPWIPYLGPDGVWRNASPCSCGDTCHCGDEICEVQLSTPVYDVVEVRVDGMVVPPEAYRVDAPARLVRVDGACWPSCSDLLAGCDQPGAFCVTYRRGLRLDAAAIAAVSELTCELVRACPQMGKDCPCKLPGNVQRVVRQGVTVDMVNEPTSVFADGRTGLRMVDLWLAAVNPNRLPSQSRVLSPDYPPRSRTTIWP